MVGEQIQNYVNLVGGLSRATKAKAAEAAKGVLSATGLDDVAADANERVTNLAEEIMAASRANRELLVRTINAEVDKAAAKIGFARAEDLEALRSEVAELRAAFVEQSARAETAEAAATEATAVAAAAARAAEEAVAPAAKKSTPRKAPAKKRPAAKVAGSRTPTKSAAKKTTAAKTTPARKRAAVKKAPVTPAETA